MSDPRRFSIMKRINNSAWISSNNTTQIRKSGPPVQSQVKHHAVNAQDFKLYKLYEMHLDYLPKRCASKKRGLCSTSAGSTTLSYNDKLKE